VRGASEHTALKFLEHRFLKTANPVHGAV